MSSVAFTVKVPVAHLTWSEQTGRGGLLAGGGSEVVLHPEASVALIVELGSDGFAFLATLALLARPDGQGRLYVSGGIERLRTVLGWGDEKATKVFRRVKAAGFVTREQHKDPARGSRFTDSRLILEPVLYAPAAAPPQEAADPAPATFADAGAPNPPASGSSRTGVRSSPLFAGGTASGSAGSGRAGAGLSGPGPSASGFSGISSSTPGQAGSGIPGAGEPGNMDDLSDGEMDHVHEGTSSTGGAGAVPDRPGRAALVAALEMLSFTDASDVVDSHPAELLERSLRYVADRVGMLDNPGGYLRSLLTRGGPPPTGAEIAHRIDALLGPAAGTSAATPVSSQPPLWSSSNVEVSPTPDLPVMDAAEVESRLAALDGETRSRFEVDAADAAEAAARRARAKGVRLPKQAVAAERHQRLVELLLAEQVPPLTGDAPPA